VEGERPSLAGIHESPLEVDPSDLDPKVRAEMNTGETGQTRGGASIHGMTLAKWRQLSEWPLVVASLAFLTSYSFQVIANLPASSLEWTEVIIWVTWGTFFIDYAMHLYLARPRGRWFLQNLHELLILTLPVLRPLRLLRLVTLLRVMHRVGGNALRGRIVTYVLSAAGLLTYVGALAVLDAEENEPGANITTFGEALWWALTTITTVGYGDHYPTTTLGRLVAAGLMVGGIAVLGVVTASVASWLIESVAAETADEVEHADQPLQEEVARLSEQVERLTAVLEQRAGRVNDEDGHDRTA
jgi:voltage-gated potassium channel